MIEIKVHKHFIERIHKSPNITEYWLIRWMERIATKERGIVATESKYIENLTDEEILELMRITSE